MHRPEATAGPAASVVGGRVAGYPGHGRETSGALGAHVLEAFYGQVQGVLRMDALHSVHPREFH